MIVEIRTYRLVPGTSEEFVRVMQDEAGPLLDAAGIRVVTSGLSQVPEDCHEEAYLVRAFDSIEHRDAQEEAFYSSRAWHVPHRRTRRGGAGSLLTPTPLGPALSRAGSVAPVAPYPPRRRGSAPAWPRCRR